MTTDAASDAYSLILGIYDTLNVIILVWVSMGLSFHDENSMMESSIRSFRMPDGLNHIPQTRSIDIIDDKRRDNNIVDLEIQMVER